MKIVKILRDAVMARPPIFETAEQMQDIIDKYFKDCEPEYALDNEGRVLTTNKGMPVLKNNPPTITGLALALGFSSRGTIYEYEKKNDQFSYAIKKARLRCENWIEECLYCGNIPPAAGIFALKNYGWTDRQEIDIPALENVTITINGK